MSSTETVISLWLAIVSLWTTGEILWLLAASCSIDSGSQVLDFYTKISPIGQAAILWNSIWENLVVFLTSLGSLTDGNWFYSLLRNTSRIAGISRKCFAWQTLCSGIVCFKNCWYFAEMFCLGDPVLLCHPQILLLWVLWLVCITSCGFSVLLDLISYDQFVVLF